MRSIVQEEAKPLRWHAPRLARRFARATHATAPTAARQSTLTTPAHGLDAQARSLNAVDRYRHDALPHASG
jgi:hypothetical protein